MLGGIDVGFDDAMHFSEQTITDNVNLLPPEQLREAYSLVAEYGRGFAIKIARRPAGRPVRRSGRGRD